MLYKTEAKWFREALNLGLKPEQLDKVIALRAKQISGAFSEPLSKLDSYLLNKIPDNTTWDKALRIVGSRAKLDDLINKRRRLYDQFFRPSFIQAYEGLKQTADGYNGQKNIYRLFVDSMKNKYGIDVMSWQDLRKAVGTNRPLAHGHNETKTYKQWLDMLRSDIGWYSPNVGVSTGYALSRQAPLSLVSHPGLSNKRLKRLSHAHVANPNESDRFIRKIHSKFLPENIDTSKNYELELNPLLRERFISGGRVLDVWPFGSMPRIDAGHGFSRRDLDNVGFARFDGSRKDSQRVKRALNKWSDDTDTDIWGPQGFKYRVPWKQWL